MTLRHSFAAVGAASIVAALAACVDTTPVELSWRQGVSVSKLKSDSLNCEMAATRAVPINNQVGVTPTYRTPVYQNPSYTSCYGGTYSVSCTTTGGGFSGGQTYGGQVYTYDANSGLRESYFNQCMAQRGYSPISIRPCTPSELKAATRKLSGSSVLPPPSEVLCGTPETGIVLTP